MLFNDKGVKWWADASSTHLLSRAAGHEINQSFYNFVICQMDKKFYYGFTLKVAAKEDDLVKLAAFGEEDIEPPEFLTKVKIPTISSQSQPPPLPYSLTFSLTCTESIILDDNTIASPIKDCSCPSQLICQLLLLFVQKVGSPKNM